MTALFSILGLALSFVLGQEFDGQVKEVFTNYDISTGPFVLGPTPPAVLFPLNPGSANISDTGLITTLADPGTVLYGLQEYSIEEGEQLHFQMTARFASQGLPSGPSGDPSSGAMMFGPWWGSSMASWILTDLAEYAIFQFDGRSWCIPLGLRTPEETATYTVIIDRSALKIRFHKNHVNLLVAPGNCGIDSRFANVEAGKLENRCEPILGDLSFAEPARMVVWIGNFFNFMIDEPTVSPFCQGCVFDQCHRSISHAFGCHCEHPLTQPVPLDTVFGAQIDTFKIFSMEKTERCPGESSSSSIVPWYQRPVQLDQVDQSETEEQS